MMKIEAVEVPQASDAFEKLLNEYERNLPPELRDIPERNFSAAFLARIDETYAGCVAVRLIEPRTAVLQRLYVQPAHRGQGAARALAQAAIAYAREHACARVVLDTDAEQLSAAAALYRSLGFTECEPYAAVTYRHPTYMELRLQ